ncbi:hypothetical protein EZS27_033970 [termite gut metagenome]|uniref:Uncharacterized protein n=1 Tax=termite gut metagenome TaxID=433724 RepID=A0A5J4Q144_9ZZZZ
MHFICNLVDGLHSFPRTATYCNPTDIVWMTWIEEDEVANIFYDYSSGSEKELIHTITKVVQNGIEGKDYLKLPSKKIRELMGCYEFLDGELKNSTGNTIAFNHKISDSVFSENQELVLVDTDILEWILERERYEIVWFVDLFRGKNSLNENLDKGFYIQKTRKYFIWRNNNQKEIIKFWDEYYSNRRDKDK